MNAAITVARKELRGMFQSPIALIFLGVFLVVTLFTFFTTERFFGRNLADVRPLFEWLPLLLIFLVSAVTMRAWAEERRMGTLELLLTLPLTTKDLVLGKFLAALALVATALALTLPLPLMVASLGELDWGPVVGGYAGALMLGAAYVAIGLAVSARTDNQIVALMMTLCVGGAMYMIGAATVVDLTGTRTADLLRALGTGSRFESIGRGVFDVRDFTYYVGIVAIGLVLNAGFLETARVDRESARGQKTWARVAALCGLVIANVVLANVWLAPVTAARVDLTENHEYSLTSVTERTLDALDEPLVIEGYFSERSHPLLAPLVPQIRDLLSEYEIAGHGRVSVRFADPNADEEIELRIQEEYGIRAMPFQVADRTQQSVLNAFFHVVVRYGDQYEVLSFDDLIEVQFDGTDVELRLRNFEYDLTRTIRRVTQDFQTIDSMLAALPTAATLTFYVTPDDVPDDLRPTVDAVRTAAEEIAEQSGRFAFVEVDPSDDPGLQQELMQRYNVRPLAVDFFGESHFYLDLVLESGSHIQRIVPRETLTAGEVRTAIEASIERIAPGQLTTVGLATFQPPPPNYDPNIPPQFQPPPERADYNGLRQILAERHDVRMVDLATGTVPAEIDVLLIAKPDTLDETSKWAVDQFLMRGGAVIALAGRHQVEPSRSGLSATRVGQGLQDLLEAYGVSVESGLVLDPQAATFPVPSEERRGNVVLQRVNLVDYLMFPDVRPDGFDRAHPALAGLANLTVPWASPLSVDDVPEGVEATVLVRSTDGAWIQTGSNVSPDFEAHPDSGFEVDDVAPEVQALAVALHGTFPSYFRGRQSPVFAAGADEEGSGEGATEGRTLTESLPSARLAVVGSAEIVSDLILQLSSQPGGESHRPNVQLVENLIDWAVADTDLLEIRSAGAFARTLRPMDDEARHRWEAAQYGVAMLLVAALALVPWYRRRSTRPFTAPAASHATPNPNEQ